MSIKLRNKVSYIILKIVVDIKIQQCYIITIGGVQIMTKELYQDKMARKNIYMSKEIATWYEEQAAMMGVSQSNLMTMVLHQYINQQKSVDMGEILKTLSMKLDEN